MVFEAVFEADPDGFEAVFEADPDGFEDFAVFFEVVRYYSRFSLPYQKK